MSLEQRYALISVSDKQGVVEFARQLTESGFTLLSTGGTAKLLRDEGLDVKGVSEHTGFPEIMDGRVKTLHPKIHGGILGRAQDSAVMAEHEIDAIDIVVVNLYPFAAVTARDDCTLDLAIENIDIGGPAMVRAAAKNNARVAVVTEPDDYADIAEELSEHGRISARTRLRLATRAYAHTARYDGMVADYLSRAAAAADEPERTVDLPLIHTPQFQQSLAMRYGENPHQQAAFYTSPGEHSAGLAAARTLQGKVLSYNNIADADAALECVNQFSGQPACVIVKHANPCGAALAHSLYSAYDRAHATDTVSAFGGIIAFNQAVDEKTAAEILSRQFVEVVIAPGFDEGALRVFSDKPNIRVLEASQDEPAQSAGRRLNYHRVAGGLLIQQHDNQCVTRDQCRTVGASEPGEDQWRDLMFAWAMVRMVKSNAIVYAREQRTVGIGAGQMSRVDSSRIAAWKANEAGLELKGSVMASDAFFPFRDSIDAAAEAGISAIIQPGGSMRDDEVIAAAQEHGMAMVFTGMRHFRH